MATSEVTSASSIQVDYMRILVAQLQNQNPLDPLNNNEMASQLAQFSQLQQLESMNSSFAKVLSITERSYASSLIGRQISFLGGAQQGNTEMLNGIVEQAYEEDGVNLLVVGSYVVGLEDVVSVRN